MKKRWLTRKEKRILDQLDRLIAGQEVLPPSGYLEEKLVQTIRSFRLTEEQRASEQGKLQELMSGLSHQLKTPLSALSVHLELASDDSLTEGERREALTESRRQAEKVGLLTDALFKAARLETGLIAVRKVPGDLAATIRDAVAAIRPMAEAGGLAVDMKLPDSLDVPHDPLWTKEALLNLLDNAVKYTASGAVTVAAERGAIYTRVDVSDTGAGIAPEDYTKIFSRFYRVRPVGMERVEGMGLGLPIAREILRQQQGNLTVSSVLGKGSVFSLFLQNR